MKNSQKHLSKLRILAINWILASTFWIACYTANAQTSIPYSGGLITIDSVRAQRIQTDLLQLQTYKEMARITDTQLKYYQEIMGQYSEIKKEQSKLIAQHDQERRIYKKRLFWSRCEIWGYRIGIIGGFVYFIAR